MPHPILESRPLSPQVRQLVIRAPHVTRHCRPPEPPPPPPQVRQLAPRAPHSPRHCRPGQFVIIRDIPDAERIPLTIASADPRAGTITLIIQTVGATTRRIGELRTGDALED